MVKIFLNIAQKHAEMRVYALSKLRKVVYDISANFQQSIWLSIFFLHFPQKITIFSAKMHGFVKKMKKNKENIFQKCWNTFRTFTWIDQFLGDYFSLTSSFFILTSLFKAAKWTFSLICTQFSPFSEPTVPDYVFGAFWDFCIPVSFLASLIVFLKCLFV